MKSNDNIPEDEMLLAEALSAARARNMKWNQGAPFAVRGEQVRADDVAKFGIPSDADACCAVGALYLAGTLTPRRHIAKQRRGSLVKTVIGNDWSTHWEIDNNDSGESLGWAFRCAMEDQ